MATEYCFTVNGMRRTTTEKSLFFAILEMTFIYFP